MILKKAGGFVSEFKRFAIKGNAFELAIAVVIGNAFTGVVNSLVGDIMTPLLGLFTNNVDLKTLTWTLGPDLVIRYGSLLQALFNFLVVSVSIFAVFKLLAAARERFFSRPEDTPPAHKPDDIRLLEEIRDILQGDAQKPRT